MKIRVFESKRAMGIAAAQDAATLLHSAVKKQGHARLMAATGASQFDLFEALTARTDVPWGEVSLFHLDEYFTLPAEHPAILGRYLRERFISKVNLGSFHLLDPVGDPEAECKRVGRLLQEAPIDVAFVGIGENGHVAFNDPPADFETETPYKIVHLDMRCRRQQMSEGWFRSLDEVPKQAVSITVRQILKCRNILCVVPEARKAQAVADTLHSQVSPQVPASILKTHGAATLYLDKESSSLLTEEDLLQS